MSRLNKPFIGARTHEGAPAVPPANPLAELRRAVASCLLWEDQFYEDGVAIADRIAGLVPKCEAGDVAALAVEARSGMKLRHAPLWLLTAMGKARMSVASEVYEVCVQRADEMGELIAMHWKDGKTPLPAALKRGLAVAFGKFDAYQLGKYDRKDAVKLKDVLRLVHPKPASPEQAALWKSVIDGTIAAPDTWEVALSGGADKKETFERLLAEHRLGYLALLRNLRNMGDAGVERDLVNGAILARKGAQRVLPFRFITAARYAPMFEPALSAALEAQIEGMEPFPGRTVVAVDVSASMNMKLSQKSVLRRADVAAALGSIINGDVRMIAFATEVKEVPARRGLAGVDAIASVVGTIGCGTNIGGAVSFANKMGYDRLIVITDEQSHDSVGGPLEGTRGYMVNVGAYQNGIGYGAWTRISGFSENVLRFVAEHERETEREKESMMPKKRRTKKVSKGARKSIRGPYGSPPAAHGAQVVSTKKKWSG